MGIAASLLICAAAAAQVGEQEAFKASAPRAPIGVQARATAQILAGAEVRFGRDGERAAVTSKAPPQVTRGNAGILWVEFS